MKSDGEIRHALAFDQVEFPNIEFVSRLDLEVHSFDRKTVKTIRMIRVVRNQRAMASIPIETTSPLNS